MYVVNCITCTIMNSDINERNRKQSILDAEEALKREADEKKQIKADPFTRRQCRPTLVTKVTLQLMLFLPLIVNDT